MWPLILGIGGAATLGYELGKDFGLWGVTPITPPPPGVLPDGKPVMTGVPAVDMARMLAWTGYRLLDQPLYKLFQQSAGLKVDGWPGPLTMGALRTSLNNTGIAFPNVPVYPFTSWGAPNGPSFAEWMRGIPASAVKTTAQAAGAPPVTQADLDAVAKVANVAGHQGGPSGGYTGLGGVVTAADQAALAAQQAAAQQAAQAAQASALTGISVLEAPLEALKGELGG